MPALNLYLNDARIDNWQQLTEAPVTAATTCGWVVGTGTTNRSKFASGTGSASERASSTFDATTYPNGTLDTTLFDCWRTSIKRTGSFAAGTWTVTGAVRNVTQTGSTGILYVRVFRSKNTDGSSATEITSGIQTGSTTGTLTSGADGTSTVTFNPGAVTLNDEYLFFQIAWGRVGAGGNTNTDVHFRTGSGTSTGTRISTPNFQMSGGVSRASGAACGILGFRVNLGSAGPARAAAVAVATAISLVTFSTPVKSSGLARGQLSVTAGGTVVSLQGQTQGTGQATAGSATIIAYAAPSRAPTLARGQLGMVGGPTQVTPQPSMATGRAVGGMATKQAVAGRTAAEGLLPSAPLPSKVALGSMSRAAPRELALLTTKVAMAGRLLDAALASGQPFGQAATKTTIVPSPLLATGRASAALKTIPNLLGTVRATERLIASSLPSKVTLTTSSRAAARLVGAGLTMRVTAAPVRTEGVASGRIQLRISAGTGQVRQAALATGVLTLKDDIGWDLAHASTSGVRSGVSQLQWNHTVTGTGTARALAIMVTFRTSTTQYLPTSVTYGALPCTPVDNCATDNHAPTFLGAQIWQLKNPPAGTALVTVTFNGPIDAGHGGALTFLAVSTATPFGPASYANGGLSTGTTTQVNVPSLSRQVILDVLAVNLAPVLTKGTGQTELWNLAAAGIHSGAMSLKPATPPTTTMTWQETIAQNWTTFAVAVQPEGVHTPQIAGLIRSHALLRGSAPKWIYYATPSRIIERVTARLRLRYDVGPAIGAPRVRGLITFGGGPTTSMGTPKSRVTARLIGAALQNIYYAAPMRDVARLLTVSRLRVFHDTAPLIGTGGIASGTLRMAGVTQTVERHSGGRAFGRLETLFAVAPLKGGVPRLTGTVQFAGGPPVVLGNVKIRAEAVVRATQLRTTAGTVASLTGRIRSSAREINTSTLQAIYYAGPMRDVVRIVGSRLRTVHQVGPLLHTGGVVQPATFTNARVVIGLQGRIPSAPRLTGLPRTRPQMVGYTRTTERALGTLRQQLPLLLTPLRGTALINSTPLQLAPPVIVTIQGGRSMASASLTAILRQFWMARPTMDTSRLLSTGLGVRMSCIGVSLDAGGQARGELTMQAPPVRSIHGFVLGFNRVVGVMPHTYHVAGPILSMARSPGTSLSQQQALSGVVAGQARTYATLQFTGGGRVFIQGRLLAHPQAGAQLMAVWPAQPIRTSGVLLALLQTKSELVGTVRAEGIIAGAFPNPYERAKSVGTSARIIGVFQSALPLSSGQVRSGGRVSGLLRGQPLVPKYVFLAQCRHYVFDARTRSFVVAAKSRVYVFYA